MAYLPTQPMFIGGAAKSPFRGHHPGKLDEEAGTWGYILFAYDSAPTSALAMLEWLIFFGTVFVNSWDQKKCPVYIASHMAAHSVFCFEEDERCLLPSSQLFGGVHWPEKWLGYASPPTQRLILFLSAGRPFPTAFPIISQGKTLFFPFRESVQSLDCLH